MARLLFALGLVATVALTGCAKGVNNDSGASGPFGTPQATFEQLRKALLNRDADLTWECLGTAWRDIFETGRKELLAKSAEEKEKIAREGMVSAKDIEGMTAKTFFTFYFNLQKRDVYQTNAPEIIMEKANALSGAVCKEASFKGLEKNIANLRYDLAGASYVLPMKKEGERWLLDARQEEGQFHAK